MPTPTFPTLPLIPADGVKRSTLWRTKRLMSSSGKRSAARKQTAARYRYVINVEWLRQVGLLTEVDQVLALFNAVCGRWATFNFVDPYDGVQRLCEFDSDELEVARAWPSEDGTGGFWNSQITMTTVL